MATAAVIIIYTDPEMEEKTLMKIAAIAGVKPFPTALIGKVVCTFTGSDPEEVKDVAERITTLEGVRYVLSRIISREISPDHEYTRCRRFP